VTTEELIEALSGAFSPTELDWELVGVSFVQTDATPQHPAVDVMSAEPPWATDAQPDPTETPAPSPIARAVAPRPARKWLPEHDEIMAAVSDLSWEGYRSMISDVFRRDGYEVFEGEGLDGDVIDMEIVRGAERMLVNCQLRGVGEVGVEPLAEMSQVVARNGADGVFIISDGDFAPEAWALADGQAIILVDRETLLNLVLEFTLGVSRDNSLRTQVRRLLSGLPPRAPQWAS
jgi:hypothetical protein